MFRSEMLKERTPFRAGRIAQPKRRCESAINHDDAFESTNDRRKMLGARGSCVSAENDTRINGRSGRRALLRQLVQSRNQVFQGGTLVDVVDVDVADDSTFIDHEECSLSCSIAAQHTILAGSLAMGI